MNNLAYSTQDPGKVASNIEEIVRKDLESSSPLIYSVNAAEQKNENGLLAFSKALSVAIFGGKEKLLCTILFEIKASRPVEILVMVNKMGIGSHVGSIMFSTTLNKKVEGTVNMEGPRTFGSSKFIGDAEAIKKLNGNKELLKLTEKFARTKSDIAGGMKMERYVNLEPAEGGAALTIVTLPRAYSMGLKATTDANDFISIAGLMEQTL